MPNYICIGPIFHIDGYYVKYWTNVFPKCLFYAKKALTFGYCRNFKDILMEFGIYYFGIGHDRSIISSIPSETGF